MSKALPPETIVAVIGAGAMGAGIALVAAAAGHTVRLIDARAGAAAKAAEGIAANFRRLAEKGKLATNIAQAAATRIVPTDTHVELADCGLVIEAIVEDLAAKQALFSELETIVGGDCVFATNTSSISITAIASALKRPERLVGMHFFNPAPVMALVEIVSGLATAPEVAATLFATATAWGKTAVHAKSTPGFIVNRVARPFYGEALRLLGEGAADCATLDAIFREAGGFRMGPFELMDMIGLDVNYAVTCSVWNACFNDPRYAPSLIQQELVAAGFLGRKSGRGFYRYGDDASPPVPPQTEAARPLPCRLAVCGDTPAAAALAERLAERGVEFARLPSPDGRIAEADQATLFVTDGRTATRRAAKTGRPDTVLVDLALDYAGATRIAIATAQQCDPAGADSAIGLLQAAGFSVSRLADLPGLAVMRTVAMLANEGADAVNQGVCDAASVDAAMRLGTNYPRGPLAWADAIGLAEVRRVLKNLAENYGEDRYRISPLIHHKVHAGAHFHE